MVKLQVLKLLVAVNLVISYNMLPFKMLLLKILK